MSAKPKLLENQTFLLEETVNDDLKHGHNMVKVGDGCNISYHDMTWYVATCRNLRVLNSSGQFPWNIGTCMQKKLLLFRVLNNCYILNKYDLTDLTRFNALTQISVVMRFHSKWWCSTAVSNFQLNGPRVFLVDLWTISFIACQAAKICEVQNLAVFSTWPYVANVHICDWSLLFEHASIVASC